MEIPTPPSDHTPLGGVVLLTLRNAQIPQLGRDVSELA